MDNENIITKIFEFLERERFSLVSVFIYVFLLSAIRSVLEGYIFDYQYYSYYLFINHTISYVMAYFVGIFLIYAVTKIDYQKLANFIAVGYFVLILPPLLDLLVFKNVDIYYEAHYGFISPKESTFESVFFSFSDPERRPGQKVMGILMFFGVLSYVTYKIYPTLSDLKESKKWFLYKILKIFNSVYVLFLMIIFFGAYPLIYHKYGQDIYLFTHYKWSFLNESYFPFFIENGLSPQVYANYLVIQQKYLMDVVSYTSTLIVGSIIFLYLYKRNIYENLLKNFVFKYEIGVQSLYFIGVCIANVLVFQAFTHWSYILTGSISLLFANISFYLARSLQKDPVYQKLKIRITIISIIMAVILGSLLGMYTLLLLITYLVIGLLFIVYFPSKNKIKYIIPGLMLALPFTYGYFTPTWWLIIARKIMGYDMAGNPVFYEGEMENISFTHIHSISNDFIIILILILIFIPIIYYLLENKISFGKDIGDNLIGILLSGWILSPIILFGFYQFIDLIILAIFAVVILFLTTLDMKKKYLRCSMIYFFWMIYFIIRFENLF